MKTQSLTIAEFLPPGLEDVTPTAEMLANGEAVAQEFDPLVALAKHCTNLRQNFGALRTQFDTIGETASYISSAVEYAPSMQRYLGEVLKETTKSPDHKNVALLGVAANLLAAGQFSDPIEALLPFSGNHYGYDRSDSVKKQIVPAIFNVDSTAQVLGVVGAEDNPIEELGPYLADRS